MINKNEFFKMLMQLSVAKNFILLKQHYWRVANNKTIENGKSSITWEEFYILYQESDMNIKKTIESELKTKSSKNYNKPNLLIRLITKLAKKHNFYNIFRESNLVPFINYYIENKFHLLKNTTKKINFPHNILYEIIENSTCEVALYIKFTSNSVLEDFNYDLFDTFKNDVIDFLKYNELYDIIINNLPYHFTFDSFYETKRQSSKNFFNIMNVFEPLDNKHDCFFWQKINNEFYEFIIDKLLN